MKMRVTKIFPSLLMAALVALFPLRAGVAAEAAVHLDPVRIDLGDEASLQRGARTFVNYCLSCHSASYMRYNRMGRDLGISDDLVQENMLFTGNKTGELMKVAMDGDDAERWFGVTPPDLTLTARSRSPEWIYTYLRSFYRDPTTRTGWNNTVFENVSMPHVLYRQQGVQRAVFHEVDGKREFEEFELASAGAMSPQEYDETIRDLTNFMVYMAEPVREERKSMGIWVIAFLLVLAVLTYLLKHEYWKDVH